MTTANRIISRKTFLKGCGLTAAGTWLSGCGDAGDPFAIPKPDVPGAQGWVRGQERIVSSACAQCSAGCGIRVRVVEGRAVKIEGDPSCPVNRGGIGPRGLAGLQALYDPDRFQQPLLRKGPRFTGRLEPVSWDSAMELLSRRLAALREEGRSDQLAILCGRERGLMRELLRRFAQVYGSPYFFDGFASRNGALANAVYYMQGATELPAYDWPRTQYILSLGTEVFNTSCQMAHFSRTSTVQQHRAKIVHVASSFPHSMSHSDESIMISPGTYGAFALGLAGIIVDQRWHDVEFVEKYGFGFNAWKDELGVAHAGFADILKHYTPGFVSELCGIEAPLLWRIAKEIAQRRPAIVLMNTQEQFSSNGLPTALAVHALNALLGSMGRPGGILRQVPAPVHSWPEIQLDGIAREKLQNPVALGGNSVDYFFKNELDRLPGLLLERKQDALDTLLLYYSNPLYSRAHPATWREALQKVPFIVSFSPFADETATFAADLVLPDHTYLERWEDSAPSPSLGFPVFGIRQPVVEPLYDTRATGDVIIQLARQWGGEIAKNFPWQDFKSALSECALGLHESGKGSIQEKSGKKFLKKLFATGHWSDAPAAGESPRFHTPSGKFEFYSLRLKELLDLRGKTRNLSPRAVLDGWGFAASPDAWCLPRHEAESAQGATDKFPLLLHPYRRNTYAEGSGANLPLLQDMAWEPGLPRWETLAWIHPAADLNQGVAGPRPVELESPHGKIRVFLILSEKISPGEIVVAQGGGHTAYGRFAKGWGGNVLDLVAPDSRATGILPIMETRVRINGIAS